MSSWSPVSMKGVFVLVAASVCISASLRAAEVEWAQEEEQSKDEDEYGKRPFYWNDGLFFGRPEKLLIQFGTALQNDSATFVSTEDIETALGSVEGGVEWRRARVYAHGLLSNRFEFKLQYDFATRNPPKLKDAYVGLVNLPFFFLDDVRAGRFRSPLGLEGSTTSNDVTFLERSLMTVFLPSRNTGIVFHGDAPDRRMKWSVAFVQQEDDFGIEVSDNASLTARFAAAFKPKGTLFHVGADYANRKLDEKTIRFLERPESHIAPQFLDTGDFEANSSRSGFLEGAVARGPLSIQGEYASTWLDAPAVGDPRFSTFYLYGSYFLTGESRPYNTDRGSFGRPRPKRAYRDGSGGLGAFELAFRLSHADLTDQGVDGGELTDFTAAVNWYPTHHLRVMINTVVAKRSGDNDVGIFQARLQLTF